MKTKPRNLILPIALAACALAVLLAYAALSGTTTTPSAAGPVTTTLASSGAGTTTTVASPAGGAGPLPSVGGTGTISTSITNFAADMTAARAGTAVTFTGDLMFGASPLVGAQVTLFNHDTGASLTYAITGNSGDFSIQYVLPGPGSYNLEARYLGSNVYHGTTSNAIAITST
jgi:hypothetical protein